MYIKVYLTPSQIKKYLNNDEILLDKKIFSKEPNYTLDVDKEMANKIKKLKDNDTIILKIKMTGGFLPIIPLLTGLAAITTIGKNIYDSVQNKRVNNEIADKYRLAPLSGKSVFNGKKTVSSEDYTVRKIIR